ncbi:hypothetical protein ACF068_07040 [Streptomyces sp. NPDC016309]|uniref:hypothetical protein n=1 Tax=Streptomyces sp. NPDC016309 TaxID=3364965 RepID=UPI0036FF7917
MFKSGVGFLALFGVGWWLLGTSGFEAPLRWVAVAAGCVLALGLMLAARRFLPASEGGPFPPERRRRFNQINLLQWLLIIATVIVCARTGHPVLVPPLVALIVGLHFVPLAAVFAQPRLRVPAAALVLAGATGLAVRMNEGADTTVRLVVGIIAALSLWGTAAWTVVRLGSLSRKAPAA